MTKGWIAVVSAIVSISAGCKGAAFKDPPPQNADAAATQAQVSSSAAAPFASPPMRQGMPDLVALVERVNPSVVNITTIHERRRPNVESDFPFDFFFGPMAPPGMRPPRGGDDVRRERALGTGFIIDAEGHVVTNAHVVDDANQVKVRLADERELDAKVIGRDARLDLAVLRLENPGQVAHATLGSSEALRVGENVVAIGNPFGLGHTVTMGIVSAKSRAIGAGPYDDFIQTDASINPGNSGGPLFNLRGEVVGIATAINPRAQGIGFAIPVDALKDVLPQLLTTGHVARGRIGALVQPVDATMAKALGLDKARGALIADVEAGGPAARAGLKAGDIIIRVDDTEVAHSSDLPRIVARHAPGTHVKLVVLRDRAERTFDVTLDELKDEQAERTSAATNGTSKPSLGIELADRQEGVVVQRVRPGSPADGHLQPGDVILEVNHAPAGNAADVVKRVEKTPADGATLFKVRRNQRTLFVALERGGQG
jgi:serine protease Do